MGRNQQLGHRNTKTPNNKRTALVDLFRTPQPEIKFDDDDDEQHDVSLAERLGLSESGSEPAAVGTPALAYNRYKSGLGWANCSPVVVGSVERKGGAVRTTGSTLVASASPGTPLGGDSNTRRILQEIREKEKQEQVGR